TVTTNESDAVSPPASRTVRVIVDVPADRPAPLTVNARPAPDPPRTTAVGGTTPGFDDAAVTVSWPAGVSESPTVKPTGPADPPAWSCTSGTSEMVGAWFAAASPSRRSTTKSSLPGLPPSELPA